MEDNYQKQLIYGFHAILEAFEAGKVLDKIMVDTTCKSEQLPQVLKLAKTHEVFVQRVPAVRIEKEARNKSHQGIIAFIAAVEYVSLENLVMQLFEKGGTPLLIMLDRISDVHNIGAIARTAHCVGADALIIPQQGGAQINGMAIKASAGALMHLPVCKERNFKSVIHYLKDSGIRIVACSEKAEKTIYEADLTQPMALLMGSEGEGISPDLLKLVDEHLKIPMQGVVSSLNVSVATAVVLYEAVRQKTTLQ